MTIIKSNDDGNDDGSNSVGVSDEGGDGDEVGDGR